MISLFILMILYAYFLFLFDCCLYNIPLQTNSLKMLEQVYYSISFSYYVLSIYRAYFSVKIYIYISFRSEFKPVFWSMYFQKIVWFFFTPINFTIIVFLMIGKHSLVEMKYTWITPESCCNKKHNNNMPS